MLQVGETVESFGGVEPVPLRLLDVSLGTLDTFAGQVAGPARDHGNSVVSLPAAHARQRRWEPWVLCSVEFELPQADTDTLAGDLGDHYAPG